MAGDPRGQEGFAFHHRDSQRFCQVLTKLFRRKTRTRLGFSFVSVLLWIKAPELAAASLSNDTREKGTFMLSSLLAYPVSVSSHLVTSLN